MTFEKVEHARAFKDVEHRVQEIIASRRNANASGQGGEDIANIRAAIQAAASPVVSRRRMGEA